MSGPFDIFNPLTDSGENESVKTDDKTPSQLAAEDQEPATVGWTLRLLHKHGAFCPANRKLKRWAMLFVFLQGVTLATLVLGGFAARFLLERAVGDAVEAKLKNLGVLHSRGESAEPLHLALTKGGEP